MVVGGNKKARKQHPIGGAQKSQSKIPNTNTTSNLTFHGNFFKPQKDKTQQQRTIQNKNTNKSMDLKERKWGENPEGIHRIQRKRESSNGVGILKTI